MCLQVSQGLVDCIDLLLQGSPLLGSQVDGFAGLDFEGQIQISFDIVEGVSLVGHALRKGRQLLVGGQCTGIYGAIHPIDFQPDGSNIE